MIAAADSVPFWMALLIGGLMIAAAVAIMVVTSRAASGALGPNSGFGIRTASTRKSDEAWQAAHQAAKPFAQFGAVALLATGVVVFALSSEPAALFGVALVGIGLMVVAMLLGSVAAVRAAKAVDDDVS
jgi:uncharacterized membrane protein